MIYLIALIKTIQWRRLRQGTFPSHTSIRPNKLARKVKFVLHDNISWSAAMGRSKNDSKEWNSKETDVNFSLIKFMSEKRSGCSSGVRIAGVKWRKILRKGLVPIGSLITMSPPVERRREKASKADGMSRWCRVELTIILSKTSPFKEDNVLASSHTYLTSIPSFSASLLLELMATEEMSTPVYWHPLEVKNRALFTPIPQPKSKTLNERHDCSLLKAEIE